MIRGQTTQAYFLSKSPREETVLKNISVEVPFEGESCYDKSSTIKKETKERAAKEARKIIEKMMKENDHKNYGFMLDKSEENLSKNTWTAYYTVEFKLK